MVEISKQANLPTQFGDFMIQSFREKSFLKANPISWNIWC